ncbi:two component transcriptional regulator, LytTR family [Chitinophaga jiangningensis]|uniref:Two component transcriptional regulator, LytTR family n=1 Tax=Chitinophaga jiangningensis TaxID=1419482 RepID=A0A1M7HS35_9BACT|nr:LytTR family DNA-binding domain-containing protein [Chitinophaga jiangningensis]SHM30937.1 two component transcriptional regulator, LytTR family [Chitinophaga jiangningensis]
MVKAVIIDDERNSRDIIALMLEKYCPFVEIAAMATDCNDGIARIREHQPQLVFLDLEMPDGTGFDILTALQEEMNFEAIFVTAFEKKFLQIIRLSEVELILKPVDKESLLQAVTTVVGRVEEKKVTQRYQVLMENFNSLQSNQWRVIISDTDFRERVVLLGDIEYFESADDKAVFHLRDGGILPAAGTFRYYLELFSGLRFYQLNNSQIVRLSAVVRVSGDGTRVILQSGSMLELSERRKKDLLTRLHHEH